MTSLSASCAEPLFYSAGTIKSGLIRQTSPPSCRTTRIAPAFISLYPYEIILRLRLFHAPNNFFERSPRRDSSHNCGTRPTIFETTFSALPIPLARLSAPPLPAQFSCAYIYTRPHIFAMEKGEESRKSIFEKRHCYFIITVAILQKKLCFSEYFMLFPIFKAIKVQKSCFING